MDIVNNKYGWCWGTHGPFETKAKAIEISKVICNAGYKAKPNDVISYRVNQAIWKSPNPLVKKFTNDIKVIFI